MHAINIFGIFFPPLNIFIHVRRTHECNTIYFNMSNTIYVSQITFGCTHAKHIQHTRAPTYSLQKQYQKWKPLLINVGKYAQNIGDKCACVGALCWERRRAGGRLWNMAGRALADHTICIYYHIGVMMWSRRHIRVVAAIEYQRSLLLFCIVLNDFSEPTHYIDGENACIDLACDIMCGG